MQYKTGFIQTTHSCPKCGEEISSRQTYSELIIVTGMEVFSDPIIHQKHVHDPSYVVHHLTCANNHIWIEKVYFKCSICAWSGKPKNAEANVHEAEVELA